MSEKHTRGSLRYDYEPGFCGELVSETGWPICAFVDEPSKTNAERLVACWNACDGIDTADLKSGSVSIIQKLHDDAAKRVLAQRDELLAALKSLEYANDRRAELVTSADYIKQMKTNGMSEALEDLDIARREARAVIAKVEGGA